MRIRLPFRSPPRPAVVAGDALAQVGWTAVQAGLLGAVAAEGTVRLVGGAARGVGPGTMRRILGRRSRKAGLAPGEVIPVESPRSASTAIAALVYDAETVDDHPIIDVAAVAPLVADRRVTWIRVLGLGDLPRITALGDILGLHPLLVEDLVSTHQRPKMDAYSDQVGLFVRAVSYDAERQTVLPEQVGLVLGPGYVLTLQEGEPDVVAPLVERVLRGGGILRQESTGYLAYAVLDVIVDQYFGVLEAIGERIEVLEQELLDHPDSVTMQALHELRREMMVLRNAVWPLREVVLRFERDDTQLVTPALRPYLRDLYDHIVDILDLADTLREMITAMLDLYLSSVNNRINEVMKVLTTMASIFIPLTFVTGIFGMNFVEIPGLHSVAVFWGVMAGMGGVTLGMLVFFRRRGWI